jgi:hypothetical protein
LHKIQENERRIRVIRSINTEKEKNSNDKKLDVSALFRTQNTGRK